MKHKAIFLDRDGVINYGSLYYTFRIEDFKFNEGVFDALKRFSSEGFLVLVISNQGGISKKKYSIREVEKVHEFMLAELKLYGIEVAEVYFCPHHSDNERCICRKPDSGMIEKAIARFDIDAGSSYFIGDSEMDVLAGEKAGLKSFRIKKNENLSKVCNLILSQ